jgi:hypothetical protein
MQVPTGDTSVPAQRPSITTRDPLLLYEKLTTPFEVAMTYALYVRPPLPVMYVNERLAALVLTNIGRGVHSLIRGNLASPFLREGGVAQLTVTAEERRCPSSSQRRY